LSQDEMQTVPDGGTLSASDFESLGSQKVQLDIDDAPFLLADEEPGPSSAEQSGALPASQDSPSKPVSRKKKIVIGGVAGLCWHKLPLQNRTLRLIAAILPAHLLGSTIVNSLALHIFYAYPWSALALRVPNMLGQVVVEVLVLRALLANAAFRKVAGL